MFGHRLSLYIKTIKTPFGRFYIFVESIRSYLIRCYNHIMKISEIYNQYQIPKNLQEHMYRVAAVGMTVTDFIKDSVPLDKDIITTTLLLHDMANIIKFSFDGKVSTEEDVEHLKKVQQDFISKYGNEEHIATQTIARELHVPEKVINILQNTGSSKIHITTESTDWYRKVCSYADFRVAPYGIVTVNERFDDVVKRYEGREHVLSDIQKTEEKRNNCLILEKQIQEKSVFPLEEITDTKIESVLKKLFDYEIK